MPLNLSGLFIPGQGQQGALSQAADLFKLKQNQEQLGLRRQQLQQQEEQFQQSRALREQQIQIQQQEAERIAHGQKMIAARDKFNASPAGSASRWEAILEFAPLIGQDPEELKFIPRQDLEKRIGFVFKEGEKVAKDLQDGKIDDRETYNRYNMLISTLKNDLSQFGSGFSQASIGQGGVQEFGMAPGTLGRLGAQAAEIGSRVEGGIKANIAGQTEAAQQSALTAAQTERRNLGLTTGGKIPRLSTADHKEISGVISRNLFEDEFDDLDDKQKTVVDAAVKAADMAFAASNGNLASAHEAGVLAGQIQQDKLFDFTQSVSGSNAMLKALGNVLADPLGGGFVRTLLNDESPTFGFNARGKAKVLKQVQRDTERAIKLFALTGGRLGIGPNQIMPVVGEQLRATGIDQEAEADFVSNIAQIVQNTVNATRLF